MKNKKLLTTLLSFLAILSMYSCHPKDEPTTDETNPQEGIISMSVDGFDITYKFNNDVINIEEFGELIRVVDDSVLVFNADALSSVQPLVGQVLYSYSTSILPYGLGNKVVKIEYQGSECVVTTSSVALDEIFEYLVIKGSKSLLDSIDGLVDDEGVAYETSYEQFTEEFLTDSDYVVTDTLAEDSSYNMLHAPCRAVEHSSSLTININKGITHGKLGFASTLYIDIDLSKKKYEVSITPSCDIQLGLGVHGEMEGRWPLFHNKDILNQVFWIGPVLIRTFESLEVDFVTKIEGDFVVGFAKNMKIKAGVNQDNIVFEDMTRKTSGKMFNILQVDAKAQVGVECAFVVGCNIFTNNFVSDIRPALCFDLSTDFQFSNNENPWYTNPSLDLSCTAKLSAEAMVLWRKDTIGKVSGEISRDLFRYGFPLLPTIEQEIEVNQDYSSAIPKFDATYTYRGGLLSRFMSIKPALNIYDGNTRQKVLTDKTPIVHNQLSTHNFAITNVDKDKIYVARPAIQIVGINMEREGEQFSCTSPTVVITDIIQRNSVEGHFFYMNEYWEYAYEHDVYISVKGSENCSEVGLYSPNSEVQYHPLTLSDGRYRMKWRGYCHGLSGTFLLIPYANLLQQQNIKYFSEVHFPLSWGFVGNVFSNTQRSTPSRKITSSLSNSQCGGEIISIIKLDD